MRVVFRADASVAIGTGHIVRCATLAEAIRARCGEASGQDVDIHFISQDVPGHLNDWLRKKGFTVHSLPMADSAVLTSQGAVVASDGFSGRQKLQHALPDRDEGSFAMRDIPASQAILAQWADRVDWLIVDHYGLDALWEKAMRPLAKRLFVIDDLANRPHDCDALLDQNWHPDPSQRYAGLISPQTRLMLGPEYALLRPEFAAVRANVRERRLLPLFEVSRLLVCFGGTDPSGETLKALAALALLGLPDLHVDVVVGAGNPRNDEIEAACRARRNTVFHCQTEAMAALMGSADVALTSGGTVTWEKLCLGLPGLSVAVAENQVALSEAVQAAGAQQFLGVADGVVLSKRAKSDDVGEVTVERMQEALMTLCADADLRRRQSERGMRLVDGQGAERVAGLLSRPD